MAIIASKAQIKLALAGERRTRAGLMDHTGYRLGVEDICPLRIAFYWPYTPHGHGFWANQNDLIASGKPLDPDARAYLELLLERGKPCNPDGSLKLPEWVTKWPRLDWERFRAADANGDVLAFGDKPGSPHLDSFGWLSESWHCLGQVKPFPNWNKIYCEWIDGKPVMREVQDGI